MRLPVARAVARISTDVLTGFREGLSAAYMNARSQEQASIGVGEFLETVGNQSTQASLIANRFLTVVAAGLNLAFLVGQP